MRISTISLLLFGALTSQFVFAQVDSTAVSDSLLLKQITEQMGAATTTSEPAPIQQRSPVSANPDIGLVGDFQASYDSRGKRNFDTYLNESELSVQSVVDPYIRADFFISFGRDAETGKYGVNVEEGYLTTLALPFQLQLKAGKFKQAVGKINPLHAHALPFIDMPNAFVNYFGEGLNDEGASLSWLVPNKKFYQELTVQATSGMEESPVFFRGNNNRFIYLGHLKNFFSLTDNATLELGLTGISGPNDSASVTNIGSVDLTYKWKPVKLNTYHSLTFQNEFFYSNASYSVGGQHSFGLYSMLEYQVAKRWFLTGRYDYAQKPYDNRITEQAGSLTAGWLATEFQKIEFEVKNTTSNIRSSFMQGWLRWVFVLGAHGAHTY